MSILRSGGVSTLGALSRAAAILAFVSGCHGSNGPKPPTIARDSGGSPAEIRIVDVEQDAEGEEQKLLGRDIQHLLVDPSSMDVVADPNRGPVRIWHADGMGGTATIYLVGHAESACCHAISKLLHDFEHSQSSGDLWTTFGYVDLHAGSAEQAKAMDTVAKVIAQKAAEPTCAGQVKVRHLGAMGAIEAGSAQIVDISRQLLAKAGELGRPLVVWHKFRDNLPRFVPATASVNGQRVDLEIRVPMNSLEAPYGLLVDDAFGGVRAERAAVDTVTADSSLLFSMYKVQESRAVAKEGVANAQTTIESLERRWKNIPASDLKKSVLADLAKAASANARAHSALSSPRPGSDPIQYIEVTPEKAAPPWLGTRRDVLAKAELMLDQRLRHYAAPLIDAFLRGWPATLPTPKSQKAFDTWIGTKQQSAWTSLANALAQSGVKPRNQSGSVPDFLHRSNVVFRVRIERDDVVVRPVFIIGGSVLQVADPAVNAVYYESPSADQHLSDQKP